MWTTSFSSVKDIFMDILNFVLFLCPFVLFQAASVQALVMVRGGRIKFSKASAVQAVFRQMKLDQYLLRTISYEPFTGYFFRIHNLDVFYFSCQFLK